MTLPSPPGMGGRALYTSLNEAQQAILHSLEYKQRVEALVQHAADKLYGGLHFLHEAWTKHELATIYHYSPQFIEGTFVEAVAVHHLRVDLRDYLQEIRVLSQNGPSHTAVQYPSPQTGTHLLQQDYPPLHYFVDEILTEGLTILGGKPKKGKSYLSLDMSLSIAVGRQAFRKFETEQARVLYVSLEDGPRRLQKRLRQIQPNIETPDGLDFLYEFPRLGAGALEALEHYGKTYGVIILDVLGRMLPDMQSVRKSLSEYQEFTEMLSPLQKWATAAHVAVLLIDHVRKAAAEDIFDTIIGSQGKWGQADNGLVYERKGEEKDGVLNIAGRDLEECKIVLTLSDGHLEFLGKGESFEMDSEQNRIVKILEEEHRPMGIPEIMKAMGLMNDQHYKRFRVVMHSLYSDDRVGRTKRGLYTLYGHDRHVDDLDAIKF